MKKRFKRFLKNLWEILNRPEMAVLPGQLAFFFILSLVPAITIISYLASLLHISLDDLAAYFNLSLNSSLIKTLTPVLSDKGITFGILALIIVGIYIISNGTNSIIITADNIYDITPKPFVQRRIKALLMVVILILLFIFIAVVPVFGNFLLSLIERVTGYSEVYNIINFFKVPVSWLVIFMFIKILYTIAPDKYVPSRHVNVGAIFTSVGWIIATEVFLYYAGHFGNYSLYYSGLANVAILMIWMYILSTIFVIGLAINYKEEPYEIEKTRELEELRLAKKNHNKNTDEE